MILVAGESLVDLVAGADGMLAPRLGGAPFNVARGIARLGAACAFLGAVSSDRFGARLRSALEADGVEVGMLVPAALPTSLALAELDDAGRASYRFYVHGTAAAALTAAPALAALRRVAPRVLHVGALGLALEPIGDAIEQVVATVGDATIVSVDPNWRPGAVADSAAWRRRLGRVLPRADLVKVSTEDLARLAPAATTHDAARVLLTGRTSCVMVTDGDGDVRVLTPEGEAVVSPPRVAVVDTVGAGDAFCAGLLAWCDANALARDALGSLAAMTEGARFATLVAARACERAGADPPRRDELGWELPLGGPAPGAANAVAR